MATTLDTFDGVLTFLRSEELEWSAIGTSATPRQRQTIYGLWYVVTGRRISEAEKGRVRKLTMGQADAAIKALMRRQYELEVERLTDR